MIGQKLDFDRNCGVRDFVRYTRRHQHQVGEYRSKQVLSVDIGAQLLEFQVRRGGSQRALLRADARNLSLLGLTQLRIMLDYNCEQKRTWPQPSEAPLHTWSVLALDKFGQFSDNTSVRCCPKAK